DTFTVLGTYMENRYTGERNNDWAKRPPERFERKMSKRNSPERNNEKHKDYLPFWSPLPHGERVRVRGKPTISPA
ncbi:hypothetical protein, partial [Cedecea neteri]|uniref:hypothetical protein n=1 Tax=Cedecea neteri TaxID=158822 RepID=UPI001C3F4BE6